MMRYITLLQALRCIVLRVCLVLVAGCLLSCATQQKPVKDETITEFKRGRLKGPQYFNEYYKFQITTPRGWRSVRPKTEFLVRMTPTAADVKVQVAVEEFKNDASMQEVFKKVVKDNEYEILSQDSDTFLEQPAINALFSKGSRTIRVVFIEKGNFVYSIHCSSTQAKFDTYKSPFQDAIDSFRFTSKFLESLGQEDFFTYIVKSDDTLPRLAARFLNDPGLANSISYFNQLTNLVPNRPIDIPRYVLYKVQEGDTEEQLSNKFYRSGDRFQLIVDYNPHLDTQKILVPGTTIKVPMYFNYTMQQGDTLHTVAAKHLRFENRVKLIQEYNGKTAFRPGSTMKIPILWAARDYKIYQVQPNDSLTSIAEAFTGDINKFMVIAEFNNIPPPYELSIGQKLKIPKDIIKIVPKTKPPRKKPPRDQSDEPEEEEEEEEDLIFGPIYEPD